MPRKNLRRVVVTLIAGLFLHYPLIGKTTGVLLQYGLAALQRYDLARAEEYYQKMLRIDPFLPAAEAGLCHVLLLQQEYDLAEALLSNWEARTQRAAPLAKHLLQLAAVGSDEAFPPLREAVPLNPASPRWHEELAKIHKKLEKSDQANLEIRRAKDLKIR